jgi:hypothetical protein
VIRRNAPRTVSPTAWLLIPQRQHARLSYELAEAWGNAAVPPLMADNPATRKELFEAIRLHDAGWSEWEDAPGIDPAHGRPYNFTEMPPSIAQRLWSDSIDACRAIGPLASWIVAGHFIHLQSVHDHDHEQWAPWIDQQQSARGEWLAEWQSQSKSHTLELAQQALFYLQTFDWLSLWLCCLAPAVGGDPAETLDLGDGSHGIGPIRFTATGQGISAAPWPFDRKRLRLSVRARTAPIEAYSSTQDLLAAARPVEIAWKLVV